MGKVGLGKHGVRIDNRSTEEVGRFTLERGINA